MEEYIEKEIESILAFRYLSWDRLLDSTILITGSTGMIGKLLVQTLDRFSMKNDGRLKIVASTRKIENAVAVFRSCKNVEVVRQSMEYEIDYKEKIDYVIHCASPTDSKYFVDYPVNTIEGIILGTRYILQLCHVKSVKSLVYLSSMEVYGNISSDVPIDETEFGNLDPCILRSSYAEAKRLAESMCVAYNKQKNVPVKIARLSQTFGYGIAQDDNRIFAQLIRSVEGNRDFTLETKGETVRNYVDLSDAVGGIILLLMNGLSGEAYNIANPNSAISVKDMAEMVLSLHPKKKLKLHFNNNVRTNQYLPTMRLILNPSKIQRLGWECYTSLKNSFEKILNTLGG